MDTIVVDHPLARRALTVLRDERTDRGAFRTAMDELAALLVLEATSDLRVDEVETPTAEGTALGVGCIDPSLLVPILRAGLGLLGGALALIPSAPTGFIGLRRDEHTLAAERYLDTVPAQLEGQDVLVLDPMLATGGSMVQACQLVRERGPRRIVAVCVVGAPEGVDALAAAGTCDRLVLASIDQRLSEAGRIVPGLGDAGDRLFGPR